MKTITYHGPSDQLRVDGRLIPRGVAVTVPDRIADEARRRCGSRVTVHDDDQPSNEEGQTEGER